MHNNLYTNIVVGEEEQNSRSVNVRNRDDVGTKARSQMLTLEDISSKLLALKTSRSLKNQFA
jgi:threonyl-tRNA synthetase